MKKLFFILLTGFLTFFANAQQWVNFSSSESKAPELNLLTSNAHTVNFEITIPGLYTIDTVVNQVAFTRLILPNGGTVNSAGSPEIPVLKYQIAIPHCDGVEVAYNIGSRQSMISCWVYPVPEIVSDGNGNPVEQFAFDVVAYSQPRSSEPTAIISSSGALRAQRYVEVAFFPVEFCPVTRQLSVIDQIEIALTFTNPQGELRQNTGIFNKVAANTFINYDDNGISAIVNDKAFEKTNFTQGNVQWVTLTDTAMASQIVCDYLIITVQKFFSPQNIDLQRLAEHRAFYNGFDVTILNVNNILSLPFYYEGNPDPLGNPDKYIKEQKMRTFIRRVYEGNIDPVTEDSKLAYVLLVGDNYSENTGMPTSTNHDVWNAYFTEKVPSDYYFSCVTRDATGKYDDISDLFIGRFSVEDNEQLYNMVHKTIYYETEYSFESWRNNMGFVNGDLNTSFGYINLYNNRLKNLLNGSGWDYSIINFFEENGAIREPTLNLLNNGAVFVQYLGHGNAVTWDGNITMYYLMSNLTNDNKAPFINAIACSTGRFDNGWECFGEYITRESPTRGAVGYIGASRDMQMVLTNYVSWSLYYEICYLYYLLNNISVAGELMHTSKINGLGFPSVNKFTFNLFGDPALNILATGFKCVRKITNQTQVINYAYEVPDDCILYIHENGKLIIEEGGSLVLGNRVQVIGINNEIENAIHVKGGGFTVGQDVVFQDLSGGILLEKAGGGASYDNHKTYTISHSTFNNTPLKHRGTRLHVSNCTFNPGSDVLTSVSVSNIDSCTFNQTSFEYDSRVLPWQDAKVPFTSVRNSNFMGNDNSTALQLSRLRGFRLANNTIFGYETGISLHSSGHTLSDTLVVAPTIIKNNKISYCGTGIELYNSVAKFTGNRIDSCYLGVGLYNNCYTSFGTMLEPDPSDYQIIRDCYSIELYASSTSFPTLFRYNQIIDDNNAGNTYQDPLIWWDVKNTHLLLRPVVTYNCWGDNFYPPADLYPPTSNLYIWNPVWDCEGGKSGSPTQEEDEIETLYKIGLTYFAEEDYTNAELAFKEIIETYPESHFSIAALHELFALEHYTNQDFFNLNTYFASFTDEESVLFNTAEFLATRCYVKEREWQPAVDWYEDRIMNPPSYQDSIFAVIDLGYIHLLMEADTMGGAKSGTVRYRLEEIKPKTKQHYEENKATLLATLPQIKKSKNDKFMHNIDINIPKIEKKGILGQCTPNPTTGATTISYELYTEGAVEIFIYNSIGQLVLQIPKGTQAEGTRQANVSLTNMPKGIYHYALYINGERIDTKKLIINH